LVSFNDYPLGDLEADGASAGKGGAGSGTVLPNAAGKAATGGASAGSSATGGSSSEGGANDVTPTETNLLLVDDFQDTDAEILESQGRSGAWYVANDGRGVQTPRAGVPLMPADLLPARGESTRGAHTFGGPFSTWGALVGTSLASNGDVGVPYDLSGYEGLKVWVRSGSTAPNAAKKVRVNVLTPATMVGGGCTVCADHFGVDIPLTTQWLQVQVPLASLTQVGYGRPMLTSPNLAQALGIEFVFAVNVSFDLWLDDIELY